MGQLIMIRLVAGVLLAAAFLTAPAVAARHPCMPRETMKLFMKERYNESPIARAVHGPELIEIYATENGDTWSMVVTRPRSVESCLIASGKWWETIPHNGPGDPT